MGASKGTRVGWARCGGAFSRGISSDGEGQGHGRPTDAAVPSLGYGSDSWGICGHKQGKSYHQAGRVQAGRVEAAAKARRDQLKEEEEEVGEEEEEDADEDDEQEEEGEERERSRRSVRAGESRSCGDSESGRDGGGDDQDSGAAGEEDQEEDTADSIFLALGGLFRDASFVDQEREDGGNPIEYLPAAAAAAAAASSSSSLATSSTTSSIPLPPPPLPSSRLDPTLAPSASPNRAWVPPAPLPPPPPPPPLPPAAPLRGTAGGKLPRSPFSREADSPLRPWGAGAVVGCLADLVGADGDAGAGAGEGKTGQVRLHFFLNGRPVNGNASVPIFNTTAAAAGGAAAASGGDDEWALCPAFSCASASDGVSLNLGESPFQFPPDGLIATLGASSAEGGAGAGAGAGGGAAAAAVSAAASPSSVASSSREKRSRYGSAAAAAVDWIPHTVLGRAAERALEGAFGLEQEGRTSPSSARAHGGSGIAGSGERREVGSPHGGSGSGGVARTMAEALRSPSKKSSGEAAESAASAAAGKQGRTKGIVGGVLAVKDAAVSRCVRFDGSGWAVARRPNLTVQTLDVFLLEALVRPVARSTQRAAGSGSEEEGAEGATRSGETEEQERQEELVVLSQGGKSGFFLAINGAKAVLCLNGPEAAGEKARHATPDGVLPVDGTWFKLSVALARDTSQGMDKVPVV